MQTLKNRSSEWRLSCDAAKELVDLTGVSWNRFVSWLQRLEGLQRLLPRARTTADV